jgi:acyl transferase domain-containing protein/acyl-CoA synthetase (AMP-forming)/AMP-acid ligase II/acyl carrier protein/NADP-dependent 3-hydroxy acid dehydrogenase YdfG
MTAANMGAFDSIEHDGVNGINLVDIGHHNYSPISEHHCKLISQECHKKNNNLDLCATRILVRRILTEILCKSTTTIRDSEPFISLGLDSFSMIEFSNRLRSIFFINIPDTIAYDYPSVDALVHHLFECMHPHQITAKNVNILEAQPILDKNNCRMHMKHFKCFDIPQYGLDLVRSLEINNKYPWNRCDIDGKEIFSAFISRVIKFGISDSIVYSISKEESCKIDPQHLLLLTKTCKIIAGLCDEERRDIHTGGVFVGISTHDASDIHLLQGEQVNQFTCISSSSSIASGRVSFCFDLRGPSMSIDTACSSSLVAMHLGAKSCNQDECSASLVCGVNLILLSRTTEIFQRAGMLSRDGRCKTLDSTADGYVRSEGCEVLHLIRGYDGLHTVIVSGSAVNQDGRSSSLTAPNGPSQRVVIETALENACADACSLSKFYMHGTGTSLGDPIEIGGILSVVGHFDRMKFSISAVKTYFGHSECASGISSILCAVQQLEYSHVSHVMHLICINNHISTAMLQIESDVCGVYLPREMTASSFVDRSDVYTGTSAFAFQGTNCHVIATISSCKNALVTSHDSNVLKSILMFPCKIGFFYPGSFSSSVESSILASFQISPRKGLNVYLIKFGAKKFIPSLQVLDMSLLICGGVYDHFRDVEQSLSLGTKISFPVVMESDLKETCLHFTISCDGIVNFGLQNPARRNLTFYYTHARSLQSKQNTKKNVMVRGKEFFPKIHQKAANTQILYMEVFLNSERKLSNLSTNQSPILKCASANFILVQIKEINPFKNAQNYAKMLKNTNNQAVIMIVKTVESFMHFHDFIRAEIGNFSNMEKKSSYKVYDLKWVVDDKVQVATAAEVWMPFLGGIDTNPNKKAIEINLDSFLPFIPSSCNEVELLRKSLCQFVPLIKEICSSKKLSFLFYTSKNTDVEGHSQTRDPYHVKATISFILSLLKGIFHENMSIYSGILSTDFDSANWRPSFNEKNFHICVKNGKPYTQRLIHLPPVNIDHLDDPDLGPTCLITGGTSGIGLGLGITLGRNASRSNLNLLILVGKRGLISENELQILRKLPLQLQVCSCDITDGSQLRSLRNWFSIKKVELASLGTCIHAAGVTSVKSLLDININEIINISLPKVFGAKYLSDDLSNLMLDPFHGGAKHNIIFSSISSVWGQANASHYAAANAYIDKVVECFFRSGIFAISFRFGPFKSSGMTAKYEKHLFSIGICSMHSDCILDVINKFLGSYEGNGFIIAKLNVQKFLDFHESRYNSLNQTGLSKKFHLVWPFFNELKRNQIHIPHTYGSSQKINLNVCKRNVINYESIQKIISETCALDNVPGLDDPLIEFGLDSLSVVEIAEKIMLCSNCKIPQTFIYNYPTIRAIVSYFENEKFITNPIVHQSRDVVYVEKEKNFRDKFVNILHTADYSDRAISKKEEIMMQRWETNMEYLYQFYSHKSAPSITFGAALKDIELFDLKYFGIGITEASLSDPQQRILVIITSHLERCRSPHTFANQDFTSTYVGITTCDYQNLGTVTSRNISVHTVLSSALNIAPGRIAYIFNLNGPAIAIDTACSSSLVAMHTSSQSLSELVRKSIVLGVNLTLLSRTSEACQAASMLSRDGRCKTLDAGADGYVRGEACLGLSLKLFSAQNKCVGKIIMIAGSHANQDGRSSSLTAPNGLAQEAVISSALSKYDVKKEFKILELHGTGTALGDSIELSSCVSVLKNFSMNLQVKARKTKVGHSESASGLVGLVSQVLTPFKSQANLDFNMHLRKISIFINSILKSNKNLLILIRQEMMAPNNHLGGTNAFGFSGTNAHVSHLAHTCQSSKVDNWALAKSQRCWKNPVDLLSTHLRKCDAAGLGICFHFILKSHRVSSSTCIEALLVSVSALVPANNCINMMHLTFVTYDSVDRSISNFTVNIVEFRAVVSSEYIERFACAKYSVIGHYQYPYCQKHTSKIWRFESRTFLKKHTENRIFKISSSSSSSSSSSNRPRILNLEKILSCLISVLTRNGLTSLQALISKRPNSLSEYYTYCSVSDNFAITNTLKLFNFVLKKHSDCKIQKLISNRGNSDLRNKSKKQYSTAAFLRVIKSAVAEILGTKNVYEDLDLSELGFDSLGRMELLRMIRNKTDMSFVDDELLVESKTLIQIASSLHHFSESNTKNMRLRKVLDVFNPPKYASHDTTSEQNLFWYHEQMIKSNCIYNMGFQIKWSSSIDDDAASKSIKTLIFNHPILASHISLDGKQMMMHPKHKIEYELKPILIQNAPLHACNKTIESYDSKLSEAFAHPFNIYEDVLIRLYRSDQRTLLFVTHHIISDARSLYILACDLVEMVASTSLPPPLPEFAFFYHANIQSQLLASCYKEDERDIISCKFYRSKEFSRNIICGNFPSSFRDTGLGARKRRTIRQSHSIKIMIEGDLLFSLRKLGKLHKKTIFVLLLSCWILTIQQACYEQDRLVVSPKSQTITTGITYDLRNNLQFNYADVVGCFSTLLPISCYVSKNDNFDYLCQKVSTVCNATYRNSDVSFESISRLVQNPKNGGTGNALFSTCFSFAAFNQLGKSCAENITPFHFHEAAFELWLGLGELRNGMIEGDLMYDSTRFSRKRAENIAACFLLFLENISSCTDISELRLSEIRQRITRQQMNFLSRSSAFKCRRSNLENVFHTVQRNSPLISTTWDFLMNAMKSMEDKSRIIEHALANKSKISTYGNLFDDISTLATKILKLHGTTKNIRISILLQNCKDVLVAHFVSAKLGAILGNHSTKTKSSELSRQLDLFQPNFLIISQNEVENVCKALELLHPFSPFVIMAPWSRSTEQQINSDLKNDLYDIEINRYDPFMMYFTSGTSGNSKGVILNHNSICNHSVGVTDAMRLTRSDIWLHAAPMFHLVDAFAIYAITSVGGSHILQEEFDAVDTLRIIENEGVTALNLSSTMLSIIDKNPILHVLDLSSIRIISCGGSSFPSSVARHILARLGCEFFISYGMTECCGKVSMSILDIKFRISMPLSEQMRALLSSGRPFALQNIRIVSNYSEESAQEVKCVIPGSSEVGEVQCKGPTAIKNYWNFRHENKFTRDGWLRTGDLAMVDSRGFLTILDRRIDMVLIGSENVYCSEVEAALLEHDSIVQAAVFGIPNAILGEELCAYVMWGKSYVSKSSLKDIYSFMRSRVADFKVPSVIRIVHKIPMNVSGKMIKSELRMKEMLRRLNYNQVSNAHIATFSISESKKKHVSSKKSKICTLRRIWFLRCLHLSSKQFRMIRNPSEKTFHSGKMIDIKNYYVVLGCELSKKEILPYVKLLRPKYKKYQGSFKISKYDKFSTNFLGVLLRLRANCTQLQSTNSASIRLLSKKQNFGSNTSFVSMIRYNFHSAIFCMWLQQIHKNSIRMKTCHILIALSPPKILNKLQVLLNIGETIMNGPKLRIKGLLKERWLVDNIRQNLHQIFVHLGYVELHIIHVDSFYIFFRESHIHDAISRSLHKMCDSVYCINFLKAQDVFYNYTQGTNSAQLSENAMRYKARIIGNKQDKMPDWRTGLDAKVEHDINPRSCTFVHDILNSSKESKTNAIHIYVKESSATTTIDRPLCADQTKHATCERWDKEAHKFKNGIHFGNFLRNIGNFDREYFGLSTIECKVTDPQQRLILQYAQMCFLSVNLSNCIRAKFGVFIAISQFEYGFSLLQTEKYLPASFAIGNSHSVSSGRISFFFDFKGPSISVDTACSSSHVALHLLRNSLLKFETSAGISGSVNLCLNRKLNMVFSESGMLSVDGRCKVLDASADGYVRQEFCGVIFACQWYKE